MTNAVDSVILAYKRLANIPSIVGARLNLASTKVTSKWTIRNIDKGKTTKYIYNYRIDSKFKVISESDFGLDISNELLSAASPDEVFRAVIREERETKDIKKQYLEIWKANRLTQSISLMALDIHGDVYADSEFGCLSWSPDGSRVLYVAEKKMPKVEPYIRRKPAKEPPKNENDSGEKPPTKGEEYCYRQDWGEQLCGKYLSVIVVCDLGEERFTVLEGLPEDCCPGQVRFAPGGDSVVGAAWETEPRRLGLIYCTNRPGFIFNLDFNKNFRKVSGPGLSVRSPRWGGAGGRLAWLQRAAGGPHHACHQLVSTSWPLKENIEVSVLVDIVQDKIKTRNGEPFYGIYSQALPHNCFTGDDKWIILSTPQQLEVRSYAYSLEQNDLVDISYKNNQGSTSILDVQGNVLVASWSNIMTPPKLIITSISDPSCETHWQPLSMPLEVPEIENSSFQYMEISHDSSEDSVNSFSALYFAPAVEAGRKLPLVVWPHGGPHAAFANVYNLEAAMFNMLGFACAQINYRGSTGSGQASVDFLPKRAGSADVGDCKLATDHVLRSQPIDGSNVFLFGGSHGGFLVTHLSGQHPDTYAAVVTRNPVTDVAAMLDATDIADWCAVEAGFEFTERGPVSEEQLLAMRRCSPLAHVHKVKAPTAIMLGSIDKRVPFYQGLDYYRRLKANGCKTRLYLYEDNHSLSSLPVEMDNLINAVNWFLQHMVD